MTLAIKRLDASADDFYARLDELLAWEQVSDAQVEQTVRDVIADIRARGDAALVEYTNRFDRMQATGMAELEIGQQQLQQALAVIPVEQREALEQAAARIRAYAEHQKMESWSYTEADGRAVRTGWQGRLSVVGVDECDTGQGGGRGRIDYGGADA